MKRILLGANGSERAKDAARFLGMLPLTAGTEIQVVCVIDPFVEDVLGPKMIEQAEELLEQTAVLIRRPDLEVSTALRRGDADHQLIAAAEEIQADLLVVGAQDLTGMEELVLGSVVRSVVHHAHCPVLVARAARHGLRSVLLAHDGSEHSQHAVELTAKLPLPAETVVSLIHVVQKSYPIGDLAGLGDYHLYEALAEAEEEQRQQGERLLRAAAAHLDEMGRETTTELQGGDPATAIPTIATARRADLIVAGARGNSLIHRLLVGSVADRLLKQAPCSLLIVR